MSEMEVSVDASECTLNKKILNAEKARYSYVIVVGPKEAAAHHVSIRNLVNRTTVTVTLQAAREMITEGIRNRVSAPADAMQFLPSPGTKGLPAQVCQAMVCLEKLVLAIKTKVMETFRIR